MMKHWSDTEAKITMPQRMVALSVVVVAVFFCFALLHQVFLPSPEVRNHLDDQQFKHMQALLDSIRPADEISPEMINKLPALCGTSDGIRMYDDVDELEERVYKMSQGKSPYLSGEYRLDIEIWADQLITLPGGCDAAAKALSFLLWTDPINRVPRQLLQRLEWRERTKNWKAGENVYVAIKKSDFETRNPWANLPGCALLTADRGGRTQNIAVTGSNMGRECAAVAGKDKDNAMLTVPMGDMSVPRSFGLLANDINAWRSPDSLVYKTYVGDQNTVHLPGGKDKPIGLHALFTFNPTWQAAAQVLVECYAGNLVACKQAQISNPGQGMSDESRIRQVGLAVLDVRTGEVLVAASAESACYQHDISSRGARPENCPALGQPALEYLRRDEGALLNHALFTEAPPGSTVKPIMLAGFLSDPGFKKSEAELATAVKNSDSPLFLDWMFCRNGDGSGSFPSECPRTQLVQNAASSLGWNAGCESGINCGTLDILRGRSGHEFPQGFPIDAARTRFDPADRTILSGRLMTSNSDGRLRESSPEELHTPSLHLLNLCAAKDYLGCGGHGMSLVSEGFGQGNARATPLGVASVVGQLASLASADKPMRHPHIIRALLDAEGKPDPAGNVTQWKLSLSPQGIEPAHAKRIVKAMGYAHIGGTARGGCNVVMGSESCKKLKLASKTGTTTFGSEMSSLTQYQALWKRYQASRDKYRKCVKDGTRQCGLPLSPPLRPWRWYAGAFNSNDPTSEDFNLAFAVLVERNWDKNGSIDARLEHNSAAIEIGLRFVQAVQTQKVTP